MSPLPGTRLGPYEIVAALGEGGMGAVYRARDTRLGRDVAVKVIREVVATDSDRLHRFTQEAQAASALNHPNIVTVHDIGTEGDVVYMVMELVTGRPLSEATPAGGFSAAEVLRIGSQMADACATAHARQIIHRDLKPANVMLQQDGRVKVLDFGLAKFIEQSDDAKTMTQTAAGTVLGTVAYMSPEQAEGKPLDARTDVFSLGAVLYELCTGTRAFPGDSQASVFAAVLKEDPAPPEQVRADVPAELGRLIMRCLRKDPARRVQSMADLRAALDELKDDLSSGRLASGASSVPLAATANRGPWILAAAILIAVGAGAYFVLSSTSDAPMAPAATAADIQYEPQPLTSYPGTEVAGGFSPDGNQFVFSWDGESQDNIDVYVQTIGRGAPVRVTHHPARDDSPRWSSDGQHIAFGRFTAIDRISLIVIPAAGGAERTVAEFFPRVAVAPFFDLSWSSDSRFLFVASGRRAGEPSNLQRVNVATGEIKTLVSVDSNSDGFLSLDVSPDGRRLAAGRDELGAVVLEVFDLSPEFEVNQAKRFDNVTNAVDVRWTADSRDILFRPAVNSPGPLYRLSVADGTTTRQAWVGPGASTPIVSAAASRLIYTRNIRDTNIWRVAIGTSAPTMDRIAVSSFREVAPHYSLDGTRLAFHSNRSGSVQIWVANADGSQAVQLTSMEELATTGTPRWSPDGRQLVFDSNAKDGYHLFLINADGGAPRQLTTGSTRNFLAWWSPDGQWVYFASDRSGQLNVWRMSPKGGPAEQVTHTGAEAPVVDDQWLYFTRSEGADGLWRQPITGGAAEQLVPSLFRYNFAVTPKGIYYAALPPRPDGASAVRFVDFATRATTEIAPISSRVDLGLAVSPDGKYLLFTKVDYLGADLMIVEKFR